MPLSTLHIVRPDGERSIATRPAEMIVARILDGKIQMVSIREANSSLNVFNTARIDRHRRHQPLLADLVPWAQEAFLVSYFPKYSGVGAWLISAPVGARPVCFGFAA